MKIRLFSQKRAWQPALKAYLQRTATGRTCLRIYRMYRDAWTQSNRQSHEHPGGTGKHPGGTGNGFRPVSTTFNYHQLLLSASTPDAVKKFAKVDGRFFPKFASPDSAEPLINGAVVVGTNSRYFTGAISTLMSFQEAHPSSDVDYFLVHGGDLTSFEIGRAKVLVRDLTVAAYNLAAASTAFESTRNRDYENHNRVGLSGFLSLFGLGLEGYSRVIILDADICVRDSMSELWTADDCHDARVVADVGHRPWASLSEVTGNPTFNSGVLSLPGGFCGAARLVHAERHLANILATNCPSLNRFVDQKFWNIYLHQECSEVTYCSNTVNANRKLIDRHGITEALEASAIHFTGPKPWTLFDHVHEVEESDKRAARKMRSESPFTVHLWDERMKTVLRRRCQALLAADPKRGSYLHDRDLEPIKEVLLIGNGPSLPTVDFQKFEGIPKIAFNWFVNFEEFDEVAVDHLVVMSHMFFGGWMHHKPDFPVEYLEKLLKWHHRPRLWFPLYFKPLIDTLDALSEFDISYMIYEKPLKRFCEEVGTLETRLDRPLTDARSAVLTAGVPLAVTYSPSVIRLVGCDGLNRGGNAARHFYLDAEHSSPESDPVRLETVWSRGGEVERCYEIASRTLEEIGIRLVNSTATARWLPLDFEMI